MGLLAHSVGEITHAFLQLVRSSIWPLFLRFVIVITHLPQWVNSQPTLPEMSVMAQTSSGKIATQRRQLSINKRLSTVFPRWRRTCIAPCEEEERYGPVTSLCISKNMADG